MENNPLYEAREIINEVDREMALLFRRRMEAVKMVAEYKIARGLPVLDAAREEQVISRNSEYLADADEDLRAAYVKLLRETMAVSRNYQDRMMNGMKVAYSGVEGAFASIAIEKIFPTARRVAYGNFTDAYNAVINGECDAAVLPMENSQAGEVGSVTDLLFSGPLYINNTYDLAVTHDLLILPGANVKNIRRVVSHPQALSQCAKFIRSRGYDEIEYVNTALAAEYVAKLADPTVAAIASAEAAEKYGLEVAEHGINESAVNTTRFAVLSPVRNRASAGHMDMRFIMAFTVRNEAGSLARAIEVIGKHGYNMQSLRSRPMKQLLWQYYFYVECEGDIDSENGRKMLEELSEYCDQLKIIGSYTHKS